MEVTEMDRKATGVVAYLTIVGWFVAYFAGDREEAKFHLNQALVVNLDSGIYSHCQMVRVDYKDSTVHHGCPGSHICHSGSGQGDSAVRNY